MQPIRVKYRSMRLKKQNQVSQAFLLQQYMLKRHKLISFDNQLIVQKEENILRDTLQTEAECDIGSET